MLVKFADNGELEGISNIEENLPITDYSQQESSQREKKLILQSHAFRAFYCELEAHCQQECRKLNLCV